VFAAGLLTGRSLLVLAAVSAVCGGSFFVSALARKWITGQEKLVLLEQVWFGLLCAAATLAALRAPLLPYLDIVSVAMCPFLAAGRVGCLLVGCCYGMPSSVGIRYGEELVATGFPPHLVGVRLFPVQALEAAGLVLIALTGFAALPLAPPGRVLSWMLIAYALLRFGLEGLRGDERGGFLGLSRPRWMALVQFGAGVWLADGGGARPAAAVASAAILLLSLGIALRILWGRDARVTLTDATHVSELRDLVRSLTEKAREGEAHSMNPRLLVTLRAVAVAVSRADAPAAGHFHVSLSLPGRRGDLRSLCDLAAGALPELVPNSVQVSAAGVLHVLTAEPMGEAPGRRSAPLGDALYGAAVRFLQQAEVAPTDGAAGEHPAEGDRRRAAYFGMGDGGVPRATSSGAFAAHS
jgi:hypothetical protein